MITDAALASRRVALLLIRAGFNATELALAMDFGRSHALRMIRMVRRRRTLP